MRHGLVALQSPPPDPRVVGSDLEIAEILDLQADMAGRLLAFWFVLQLLAGLVRDPALRAPSAGGPLFLGLDLGNIGLGSCQQLFQASSLLIEVVPVFRFDKRHLHLGQLRRRENRVEPVVVSGRDRVELVVVALGAPQRQRQERLSDVIGDVVQVELTRSDLLHHARVLPRTHAEVASGYPHFGIVRLQDVASQLLDYEAVVRLVGVQRAHDIVPKAPSVRALPVVGISGRVGVAHDVEPVPTPLLAVMRALKQPVDQVAPSLGRVVPKEAFDLLRCGRKTGQIERRPPDQESLARSRGRFNARFCELLRNERVDGMRLVRLGYAGLPQGAKRPEILGLVSPIRPTLRQAPAGGYHYTPGGLSSGKVLRDESPLCLLVGPRCAGVDPVANLPDLLLG